jgi:GT2 family glycosyltransferase
MNEEVAGLSEAVKKKDEEVAERGLEVEFLKNTLRFRDSEMLGLRKSYSFRIGRVFVVPVALVVEFFKKTWFVLLVFVNFFRHPINFIRKFSFGNVGRFFMALRTESWSLVIGNVKRFFSQKATSFSADVSKLQLFPAKNYTEKIIFEKSNSPLVSIIIPVYNQWHYTYSCFLSILKNTKGIDYEVIIADDVSSDETKEINEYVENVIVVRNEKNLGFLRNCKNAAEHARGKYLLFLNNDTNVQEGWLDALLDVFEKDKKVGLVGSKLVYPDGKLQEAGGIIWKDGTGWNYGKGDDPNKSEYNYLKEVDYVSGASILLKRDLWNKIGGFDERYERAYYEDTDLAFEVRARGYKVMYQPKSIVIHFEGVSCGTSEQTGEKSYQKKNRETFVEKWESVLEKENFGPGKNFFLARDKSGGKKTILFIDHYVPHFDKDAGSRSTFQYLKLFVNMGLNVKFFGDDFYKHEPYSTVLEQLGIEVLYGLNYIDNWKELIKEYVQKADYICLSRPHVAIKYIDFIKENTKAKVLYYGQDLHYLRETRRYEVEKDDRILECIENWKNMEFEVLRKVDVAYYPSKVEIDVLKRKFPGLKAYEIPVYVYDNFPPKVTSDYSDRHGLLFVGSFNHLPNFDGLMWFIKGVFPKILLHNPEIKLYIVGSTPPDGLIKSEYKNVVMCGSLSDKDLMEIYNKIRLVVVPLRYGGGLKGKVVEAMYHSVPMVSTSIGAEGILGAKEMMRIGDTIDDFADGVIDLYDNFDVSKAYVYNSLSYVKNRFSVDAARNIIEEEIVLEN